MTYNCHCEESSSKDDEAIQALAMIARMTWRVAGMTLPQVFNVAGISPGQFLQDIFHLPRNSFGSINAAYSF